MKSVDEIVDAFGGNVRLAEIIGKGPSTVSEFKRRKVIPIEYWATIIEEALRRGIEGIDEKVLLAASTSGKAAK